jgi:hypothetical protein
MPETDLFRLFTDRLNILGTRYIVTGGVAGTLYGEPRLTLDVDIVLDLPADASEKLCRLFPPEEFYCPPADVIRVESLRPQRGHFNLIHHDTGLKADIYLRGHDPLHQWAMNSARKIEFDDHVIWAAPPEYVIVRKLQYYREGQSEKHLRDIRGMLAMQSSRIDVALLKQKVAELGLEAEWKMIGEK